MAVRARWQVVLFRVARLHRLRLADDEPLAVELAIVPATLLPSSLEELGASLYETVARHGAEPVMAQQRMCASQLPAFEATALGVPAGVPALHIERVSRTASGRRVEFTRSWYRGDRYDFVAERVVRGPVPAVRRARPAHPRGDALRTESPRLHAPPDELGISHGASVGAPAPRHTASSMLTRHRSPRRVAGMIVRTEPSSSMARQADAVHPRFIEPFVHLWRQHP